MNSTRRGFFGLSFLGLVALGAVFAYFGYLDTVYAMDRANGLLSRAQSAGYVEDLIDYLRRARQLLPREGNPVWLFPTDRTDFVAIQHDLAAVTERAQLLRNLPRDSGVYQQGFEDLRTGIRALQGQVADAAPYLYASAFNVSIAGMWTAGLILIVAYVRRGRGSASAELDASSEETPPEGS